MASRPNRSDSSLISFLAAASTSRRLFSPLQANCSINACEPSKERKQYHPLPRVIDQAAEAHLLNTGLALDHRNRCSAALPTSWFFKRVPDVVQNAAFAQFRVCATANGNLPYDLEILMLGGVSPRQHGPSYRDIIDAFLHLMHFRGALAGPGTWPNPVSKSCVTSNY